MSLYTYTTPTLTLNFPEDVDLTEGTNHVLTISNPITESVILEKTDLHVEAHQVDVFLTQEETAMMPKGNVVLQLNWLYTEGATQRRAVSKKAKVSWDSNLKREVM